MSDNEIDMTDIKKPNAFILLMRARKKFTNGTDRRIFNSEVPSELIVKCPSDELPEWVYEKLMVAVQKRFNVITAESVKPTLYMKRTGL